MSSPCKIQMAKLNMRVWRNWQTRKIQVLVEATLYRFKSCYPHHAGAKQTLLRFSLYEKYPLLLTADVFIPFRERLYFIHRNIAIRNDNIIFL